MKPEEGRGAIQQLLDPALDHQKKCFILDTKRDQELQIEEELYGSILCFVFFPGCLFMLHAKTLFCYESSENVLWNYSFNESRIMLKR